MSYDNQLFGCGQKLAEKVWRTNKAAYGHVCVHLLSFSTYQVSIQRRIALSSHTLRSNILPMTMKMLVILAAILIFKTVLT